MFKYGIFSVLMLMAASAQAQPAATQATVSLDVNGGVSTASSNNGAAIGGRLGVTLTDRFGVEADVSRLGRGPGSSALRATASLTVNLLPSSGKTVPYVTVGGGVYRASFDMDHDQMFGRLSNEFPAGTQMIPIAGMQGFGMMQGTYSGPPTWTGTWPGDTFSAAQMPAFYSDRLGRMMVPADGHWGMRSFTDPVISVGGGLRLHITPHVYVRPEAQALIVIAGGHTSTVGVFSIGVGYRFN